MPEFKYKAMDKKGNVFTSTLQAKTRIDCINILKRNKLQPVEIVETKNAVKFDGILKETAGTQSVKINEKDDKNVSQTLNQEIDLSFLTGGKVKTRDIIIFLQNLLVLKEANFNNIDALNMIIKSTESKRLKSILHETLLGIEAGEYMYETMERYPKIFPFIVTNIIKVGELSGTMVEAVKQSIEYIESSDAIRKRVRKIVLPNVAMFVGILAMLIICTLVAIPQIQNVFDSIGSKDKLPEVTLAFANFLNLTINYWYVPTIAIIAIVSVVTSYFSTPKGKYQWDMFKYKMPIFGKLIYSLDYTKLIRSLLLNISNGVRIQEALEVSRNVVNNQIMVTLIEQAINKVYNGELWIEPFEDAKLRITYDDRDDKNRDANKFTRNDEKTIKFNGT